VVSCVCPCACMRTRLLASRFISLLLSRVLLVSVVDMPVGIGIHDRKCDAEVAVGVHV
jgi:hypothetical protein